MCKRRNRPLAAYNPIQWPHYRIRVRRKSADDNALGHGDREVQPRQRIVTRKRPHGATMDPLLAEIAKDAVQKTPFKKLRVPPAPAGKCPRAIGHAAAGRCIPSDHGARSQHAKQPADAGIPLHVTCRASRIAKRCEHVPDNRVFGNSTNPLLEMGVLSNEHSIIRKSPVEARATVRKMEHPCGDYPQKQHCRRTNLPPSFGLCIHSAALWADGRIITPRR